jgi:ribose transport system substrate-binding protein
VSSATLHEEKHVSRATGALQRYRPKLGALVATLALVSVAASACGSSSSNSSSAAASGSGTGASSSASGASASAAATVASFGKPVTTWPGPNTPFTPPTGDKVTVITCSSTGITCVRVANGVVAAGKVLGWSVNVVDGKGDPTVWNSAIREAIADKSNGIVLAAVVPALASGAIQAARAAHIPVIYTLGNVLQGTNLAMDTDRSEAGRVLADWTAVDSGGKAQVLVLYDNEFPELVSFANSYVAELAMVCPACKVVGKPSFTLETFATTLPGIVSNAMRDNPGLNYVLAPYDSAATFIQQGARQVARTVKVMGDGGDQPTVANLKDGIESASMGVPSEWMGWQALDAIGRYLAGKPVPNTPVVQGLMVPGDITTQAPTGSYSGGFDYQASYKKLWAK